MIKRKEIPVKNNPGIYKRLEFDESSQKWKGAGKYRAIRRIVLDGISRKEQGVFDSIDAAKLFRSGESDKPTGGNNAPRNTSLTKDDRLTFGSLVERWKPFHFLQLERSTQQTYEKRLPNLDYLKGVPVEEIKTALVDDLITHWVTVLPKSTQRFTFEKELNLLKVVLNYYRKRINPSFVIPVIDEHYRAADMAKRAVSPVASLSQEELAAFLEDLKKSKSPIFFSMALAQFCLGLRIGEVCGMTWEAMDLPRRVARIEWTITWDQLSWEPQIKQRPKNGKVRILVIPEFLALELERLRRIRNPGVPFLFHCNGRPMNRQTVAKAYNRALDRLGYKHVKGTHMLRKTSATLANEETGDFYAVSKLMDHSSPNITLRYVAQTNAQKQKVADAMDAVLGRGNAGKAVPHVPHGGRIESDLPGGGGAPVPQCPPREIANRLKLIKSVV